LDDFLRGLGVVPKIFFSHLGFKGG
jgi:hypothetical protein